MYRILRPAGRNGDRRRQVTHPANASRGEAPALLPKNYRRGRPP